MGTPKQRAKSISIHLRLSSHEIRTIRTEATRSRCIVKQKHAAGSAMVEPISILVTAIHQMLMSVFGRRAIRRETSSLVLTDITPSHHAYYCIILPSNGVHT